MAEIILLEEDLASRLRGRQHHEMTRGSGQALSKRLAPPGATMRGHGELAQKRVRRKLTFNLDNDHEECESNGLDFTDKIAAFRSVIKSFKDVPIESNRNKLSAGKMLWESSNGMDNKYIHEVSAKESKELRNPKDSKSTSKENEKVSKPTVSREKKSAVVSDLVTNQTQNGDDLDKFISNNPKERLSAMKTISSPLQNSDKKRGCANFSDGLDNNTPLKHMERHSQHRDTKREKLVQDNVNLLKDVTPAKRGKLHNPNATDGDYLAKFERNLDLTPHKDQKLDSESIQNGGLSNLIANSSCSSDTLTDIGSLLNSTSSGIRKNLQSNVPHYHPAWSCDQPPNQKSAVKKTNRKSAKRQGQLTEDDLSDYASSLMFEARHKRDFVVSPEEEVCDLNKKHHRRKHKDYSSTTGHLFSKDISHSPKRSHSSRHRSHHSGSQNIHHRSRSRGKYKIDEEDVFVSDSSKENIPNFTRDKSESRNKHIGSYKSSQKYGSHSRNHRDNGENECELADTFQIIPEKSFPSRSDKMKTGRTSNSRRCDSVTGSVRSSGSQSSVINAAELIKRLYKVDEKSREELVLKARFFRRWQKTINRYKRERLTVNLLEKNISPIESEAFCRQRLLSGYFQKWKVKTIVIIKVRRADELHKKHTLKKGLMALKWAINRSRVQVDILRSRMQGIILRSRFIKWKDQAMQNRSERLQQSFAKWQSYTLESQRVRKLRELRERKILDKAIKQWRAVFFMRLQENKAVRHFRKKILRENMIIWKTYTSCSKSKKKRREVAICVYNQHLQNKMFGEMVIVYRKFCVAELHHRKRLLHQIMVLWKQASHVCKVERQRDMSVSKEHWRVVTINTFFHQWHEQLLTQRACNSANKKMSRKMFMQWRTQWEQNVTHRQEVQAQVRKEILHTSIQLWKANVDLLLKRRLAAVIYIQRSLVRHYIDKWCYYTQHRKELRIVQVRYTQTKDLSHQRTCFRIWRRKFEDKLNIQRAKQFWSNTCVRKALVQWRKLCHRRYIERLLEETEPNRALALQRVMFKRWLLARRRVEEEKQEADEIREVLQLSQLQKRFEFWWIATQRRLTVKPLLERRQRHQMTEVFDAWRGLVQHKLQCRKSRDLFLQTQLRTRFASWRRQYLVHQLEKDIRKKTLHLMLHRCVTEWRQYIKRKQAAHSLHNKAVVKHTFYYWRERAFGQLYQRRKEQELQEHKTYLLQKYFCLWCSNIREQINYQENAITTMMKQREDSRKRKSFVSWRRLFRATLIARENKKLLCRRLQLRVIEEWRETSQFTLRQAIHNFSVSLGLESPYKQEFEPCNTSRTSGGESLPDLAIGVGELMDLERSYPRSGFGSGFVSPRLSPGMGTPLKRRCLRRRRLYSPSLSSPDENKPSLIHSGFLDAKFAMEQAVKTERLRMMVTSAVKKLRNWPVSLAFEQWKEYTQRQKELKVLSCQLVGLCQQSEMRLVFNYWRSSYIANTKAKDYWERSMKVKIFCVLYQHKCESKKKKHLSSLAHGYLSITVFRKIFPYWFNKAQEKRHKERVLDLWTNVTQEERMLKPLENQFIGRLNKKTLQKCFAIWHLKFQQIHKTKTAFNNIIMKRCVDAWHDWASKRHERRLKSDDFCHNRLTRQMFSMWCVRYQQSREVDVRYKRVWHCHMVDIVRTWHTWTVGAKQRRVLYEQAKKKREQAMFTKTFFMWKLQAVKHTEIRAWYQKRLKINVLFGWRKVAVVQAKQKKKMLQFQIHSYTKLVIQMFKTWHTRYLDRLQEHEEHEQVIHRRTLQLGRRWLHKAQKTRGQHLQQHFAYNKMKQCFQKWCHGYQRNLEREDQLARHLARREWLLMCQYLDNWKTALQYQQVGQMHQHKLLVTVFSEWRIFTKESKKRQRMCVVYKKATEQNNLKMSFQYWVQMTRVRRSVTQHFDLKLQIRVLRAWVLYSRQQRQLSWLSNVMTKRVNTRVLQRTWYTLRGQYDYCQSLADMANKVVQDKNKRCMQNALSVWRQRLNRVIAGQCFHHMLSVRVARRWYHFVHMKKMERQHDAEMWQQAINHHNRRLCAVVLEAWHDEIRVVHQIQRHKDRLAAKYGKLWKLRVDMAYTARLVEEENLQKRYWKIWKVQFSVINITAKVDSYSNRQLMAQVFVAWKALCAKQRMKKQFSSIPVRNITPAPVPSPRQSHIPAPSSGRRTPSNLNRQASFRGLDKNYLKK